MVGANSPASLASRPIRILLADEVDRYPVTAGSEGDPVLLASKRLTTFWNKKEVLISTPTIKGLSRIETEYENSTQEEWCIPCPDCGALQPLEWGRLNFNKSNLDEITYACGVCGVVNTEQAWKEKFINGKFIAKFPQRKVRGFHLNSLASLFVDWSETVSKWIVANEEKKKGNIEFLKAFVNTELGETWEEEGTEIEQDDLYKRREKYDCEVPAQVIALTAGVDTQDDRFEVEVVGWGQEKESWGIKYQIIYGDLKKDDVWNKLDRFLEQTFLREDGTKLKILCTCIDSGGHFTKEVYQFTKQRVARHIYAIKGKGGADVPYISRPTTSNRYKALLFTIGVNTGKALLYQRLAVEEEGAGYCHFPKERGRGYTKDYFRGLTAEKMIMEYKKGRSQISWVLKEKGYRRNEPLDIRNYATAAMEISGVVLKRKDADTEAKTKTKKRTRRQRSGGLK